ncbi:MAG: hypothetical protein AAFW73_22450 [Bacteroidota bacterium]
MDTLQAYLSIVDTRLLHHIQGKVGHLIRTYQAGKFASEAAFQQRLVEGGMTAADYSELKSRAVKLLQAFAIVSASGGNSSVKKKYDSCLKKFTVGQKFLNQGIRPEGIRLIRQAYQIAVDYHFLHLAAEMASILHFDHVYYHRNAPKAAFYAEQTQQHLEDLLAEKLVEQQLFQVMEYSGESLQPQLFAAALERSQQLTGSSLRFKTYATMIQVLHDLHTGDYRGIILHCREVLQFYEGKKGVFTSHYHFFLTHQAMAHIATRQYDRAETSLLRAQDFAPTKSINKPIVALYQTINALHAGHYERAYDLYRQHRKSRFEPIRQQFAIIQAYFCFLAHLGHLRLDGKFRLGKYLNETFKAQSDKQGANITILIAELLVHLARDRGRFIDRVEAINNYSYRHLKGPDTKRAKRFIKILCLLPRANFHPLALQRLAARPIQYLEEHPIHLGENLAIEVIPFGDLLEMIMTDLAQRRAVG